MVKIKNREVIADLARLTELCLKPIESTKPLIDSAIMVSIGEGTGIFLNKEEARLFDKIIASLLEEHISEYVSEKFFRDSLWNYLREVFRNPNEFKKDNGKNVQKFLNGLFLKRPFDWIVVFSLGNLKCQFDLGPIGSVKFLTFTESNIEEWKVFEHERGRKHLAPYFIGKICAQVKVQASDSTKAIEKGKFEVDTALNLVRSCYGIRGTHAAIEIVDPLNVITRNLDTGAEDLCLEHDWSWGSTIETKDKEALSNYILCFDPILRKTQKTRLDKRIVRSINWCGEATRDKNLEDKLLKYFTALECLLVPEGKGLKGDILGECIAKLWNPSKETRELIKKDIIDLYEKRSNIVHGSEYEISEKDITEIDFITRNIIAIVSDIIYKNKIETMSQLIAWIKSRQ